MGQTYTKNHSRSQINSTLDSGIYEEVEILQMFKMIIDDISNIEFEKIIEKFRINYIAYFKDDLDENKHNAYEHSLNEIKEMMANLFLSQNKIDKTYEKKQTELLVNFKKMELLKEQYEKLKNMENNVGGTNLASETLKKNLQGNYRENFASLLIKVTFIIILFVTLVTQINNLQQ